MNSLEHALLFLKCMVNEGWGETTRTFVHRR
jgi:hypothetical protein